MLTWLKNKIGQLNKFLDDKYPLFEKLFEENDSSKMSLNKALFKVLSYAVLCAGLLFSINIILVSFTEKGGVFGDFLGGVLNPVLTFFTLFGLIATIVIQRQELRLARNEYEKTAEALSTQAIETTFFNILDLHHNIVDNLKVDIEELRDKSEAQKLLKGISSSFINSQIGLGTSSKSEGRAVFEDILNFLSSEAESPEEVLERYQYIQDHHNHILGHYFRNLYQALKVINSYEESALTVAQKRKYASILRAQLSTKELALLFINCLDGVSDSGQFKNLLIEFNMLEHLPILKKTRGYLLAGSKVPLANESMLMQYKYKTEFGIDFNKYYGGAFGKNSGVPYNLRPNKQFKSDS
ncbi:putative phage abortive infection protein [Photobacterium leiognathi]|uniref:putative phage abortive infection protein n=1 Tax=Photobacterium leiognathi TaxID=553611 RepID=UPI002980D736|nr:putative phage abortive infection protein [Photobacterium leiognathi]